jgi:hypothetical protein
MGRARREERPRVNPIQALEIFSSHVPRGGNVLCLDLEAAAWLTLRGVETHILAPDKDLRFLSLKRASYAGIWAGASLKPLPIEDAQRVIAAFFQALLPKTGVLFTAHAYPPTAFASLLRQNGFQPLLEGHTENVVEEIAEKVACVVSQRI